ncbi:hypothetical protein ACFLTU_06450 [Bacteroidota bacterium]
MKKRIDKEDQFVSEIMKDLITESPSPGFTDRVMQSIQAESSYSAIKASPLISKAGWIGITAGICMILVIVYIVYGGQDPSASGWLTQIIANFNLPVVNVNPEALFGWINVESPTLFWILASIGGLIMLAFIQRIIENLHIRQTSLFHTIVI